jgi:hypothetical protein
MALSLRIFQTRVIPFILSKEGCSFFSTSHPNFVSFRHIGHSRQLTLSLFVKKLKNCETSEIKDILEGAYHERKKIKMKLSLKSQIFS